MVDTYKEIKSNPQNYQKAKDYWQVAKGLQDVDNLKTSKYLDTLIEDNLSGKKSYAEVEDSAKHYYSSNDNFNVQEKEADLSAIRIAMLLNEPDFRLTKGELLYTHKFIFENAFPKELEKYIGVFRDVNISKDEDILNGHSVIYTDYTRIEDYVDYDLKQEQERINNENIDNIEHLSKFISNLWNIHPFREGNTRATAVYLLRYLNKNIININYLLFHEYSKYFRDSLVLASDNQLQIDADYSYLESFIYKLIFDNKAALKKLPDCIN